MRMTKKQERCGRQGQFSARRLACSEKKLQFEADGNIPLCKIIELIRYKAGKHTDK